jgi:hypothetical protein
MGQALYDLRQGVTPKEILRMKLKQVAAATAFALSAVPAMSQVLDPADNVTFAASYASLGGNNWALTVDIDATANTIGASFLTAIAIVPGGTFSNVSLASASDGTWGTVTNGPTSSSGTCQGTATAAFCVAATDAGASTSSPIEMVFNFTDAALDLVGPHVQVSWDVKGNHFSQTVPVAAPVPEPQTYALMLAGLGAVGWLARRRKPV